MGLQGYCKRHPTVRAKGALISAHAQVIGPVEIGENATRFVQHSSRCGRRALVMLTVIGIFAKIVRVHGQKDEPRFMKLKKTRVLRQ